MRAFILMVGVLTVLNIIILSPTTHATCPAFTDDNYKNINFKLWDGSKGIKLSSEVYETNNLIGHKLEETTDESESLEVYFDNENRLITNYPTPDY